MRNSEVMKALKAAFTGYERNSNAALLELLYDDFTFEMSDSLPYAGPTSDARNSSASGGRSQRSGPISATMHMRSSTRETPSSFR